MIRSETGRILEINMEMDVKKLADVAAKLLEKCAFSPEGKEIKEWLRCPGGNGMIVVEVPDEKIAHMSCAAWN